MQELTLLCVRGDCHNSLNMPKAASTSLYPTTRRRQDTDWGSRMRTTIRQLMDEVFDHAPLMQSRQYWVMCEIVQILHSSLDITHDATADRTIRYLRRRTVSSVHEWLSVLKRSST